MVQHDTALDLGGELSDTRWSASHLRRHLEEFRGSTLSPGLGERVDLSFFSFPSLVEQVESHWMAVEDALR